MENSIATKNINIEKESEIRHLQVKKSKENSSPTNLVLKKC